MAEVIVPPEEERPIYVTCNARCGDYRDGNYCVHTPKQGEANFGGSCVWHLTEYPLTQSSAKHTPTETARARGKSEPKHIGVSWR